MVGLEQSAVDYRPHAPLLRPPLVTHTCLYIQQYVVFIYDGHSGSLAICLALDSGIFTVSQDGHVLGNGCGCDLWSICKHRIVMLTALVMKLCVRIWLVLNH